MNNVRLAIDHIDGEYQVNGPGGKANMIQINGRVINCASELLKNVDVRLTIGYGEAPLENCSQNVMEKN